MITIFVGDITPYLANTAKKIDPTATLITSNNYKNLTAGTYYVSIGDLDDLPMFATVLRQSDTIIYSPPKIWSDENKNKSKMQEWTETYLQNFYTVKNIQGFLPTSKINKSLALSLVDQRKVENKQLWIAGCSISHGVGVNNDQRYGHLIANTLNLPVSFLTCPSSSISWAADQLLRSDIRSNDVVIWGLTSSYRLPYFDNQSVQHITHGTYIRDPLFNNTININTLTSDNTIYKNITSIFQVINFCQKLNVKLIIAGLLDDDLPTYLINCNNFIMLHGLYGRDTKDMCCDLGNDNLHPGPITHQYYAHEILKKLYTIEQNNV